MWFSHSKIAKLFSVCENFNDFSNSFAWFFSSCLCRHVRYIHCFAAFHLDVLFYDIITFWLIQVLLTSEKRQDWCLWRMRSHRKSQPSFRNCSKQSDNTDGCITKPDLHGAFVAERTRLQPLRGLHNSELSAVIAKWYIPGGAAPWPCALNVLGNEKIKNTLLDENTQKNKSSNNSSNHQIKV